MAWQVVSTTTEQVVDTNPKTWLESGLNDYSNCNYSEALYKFRKVVEYSSNSSNKAYIETEGTVFAILTQYMMRENFDVRNELRGIDITLLKDYLENDKNKPSVIKRFLEYDRSFWIDIWREIIVDKINSEDIDFMNTLSTYDWEFVAKCVKKDDVIWMIESLPMDKWKVFLNYINSNDLRCNIEGFNFNITESAAYYGRADLLKYLFEQKYTLTNNRCDANACMIAATLGRELDCLKFAIDHGADVNTRFRELNNRNPLMHIAAGRHWNSTGRKIYEYLLNCCNCNLNLQDADGNTAPMLSIDHTWFWSAELDLFNDMLREGYVNYYIRNDEDENLYDVCERKGIKLS